MDIRRADLREARLLAVCGGCIYAVAILSWMFSQGVSLSSGGITTVGFAIGYAVIGMFLTAAVPLYLFGRLSLVTPPLVTLWILGDTVYQWQYGVHVHPLSSYLTVWPILLGFVLMITVAEALLRIGLDRNIGRFGLQSLW
jgi:hypothetical protein